MNFITGIAQEIWFLLKEMAPYLLFGFLIAGVLNILIPKNKIYKHWAGFWPASKAWSTGAYSLYATFDATRNRGPKDK